MWVQGSVLWGQAGVSNPLGRPSNQSGAGGELFLEWCKGRRDSSLGKGHSKVQCMFIAALCVHTQGRAIQICQKVPSLTCIPRDGNLGLWYVWTPKWILPGSCWSCLLLQIFNCCCCLPYNKHFEFTDLDADNALLKVEREILISTSQLCWLPRLK